MSCLEAWPRSFPWTPLVLCLAACAQALHGPSPDERMFASKRSEQLYLSRADCTRIHVELDSVAGVQVVGEVEAALRACLERTCDKPDGVAIARGAPIPEAETRGVSREVVALRHMDGLPPEQDAGRTAYLYVLVDDSERSGTLPYNPQVRNEYRCAIFYDEAYVREAARGLAAVDGGDVPAWTARLRGECLLHELGHCLGLVRNPEHGAENHCLRSTCRSAAVLSQDTAMDWCAGCRADLARYRSDATSQALRFHGAFLVRSEPRYFVSYLPGFLRLSFLPPFEQDWLALRDEALESVAASRGLEDASILLDFACPEGFELQAALGEAIDDPDPLVASMARDGLRALRRRAPR